MLIASDHQSEGATAEREAAATSAAYALANIVAPHDGGPAVHIDATEWAPLESLVPLLSAKNAKKWPEENPSGGNYSSDGIVRSVARLVTALASASRRNFFERKSAILAADFVPPLVELVTAADPLTAQAAAAALRAIAHRSDLGREAIVRAGGAPRLIEMLARVAAATRTGTGTGTEEDRTWLEAARAIGVLTANNSCNQVVGEQSCFRVLSFVRVRVRACVCLYTYHSVCALR